MRLKFTNFRREVLIFKKEVRPNFTNIYQFSLTFVENCKFSNKTCASRSRSSVLESRKGFENSLEGKDVARISVSHASTISPVIGIRSFSVQVSCVSGFSRNPSIALVERKRHSRYAKEQFSSVMHAFIAPIFRGKLAFLRVCLI